MISQKSQHKNDMAEKKPKTVSNNTEKGFEMFASKKQVNRLATTGHIARDICIPEHEDELELQTELDKLEIEILKAIAEKVERSSSYQWLRNQNGKFQVSKAKTYTAFFNYARDFSSCSLCLDERSQKEFSDYEILEDLEQQQKNRRVYSNQTYITILLSYDALIEERKRLLCEALGDYLPDHPVKFATAMDYYEHIVLDNYELKNYLRRHNLLDMTDYHFSKEKVEQWLDAHKDFLCFSDMNLIDIENQVEQFSKFYQWLAKHSQDFEKGIPIDVFYCEQIPLSFLTIDFLLEILMLEYQKSEKFGKERSLANIQKADWLIRKYILRDEDKSTLNIETRKDTTWNTESDIIRIEQATFEIEYAFDYDTGEDLIQINNDYGISDNPNVYLFLLNKDCSILLEKDNFLNPLEDLEDSYSGSSFSIENKEEMVADIFNRNCLQDYYIEFLDQSIGEELHSHSVEFRNEDIHIFMEDY
jgi:hypothetical protein